MHGAGLATILACAAFTATAYAADARNYPDRPIRLIDPYAPGGGSGPVARFISQKMSEAWGKQIVIDNRPGATGAIGTEITARAAPDVREKLIAIGSDPTSSTPEAFLAFIKVELARWGKVIRENNIRAD